jgi:hypothetical protein
MKTTELTNTTTNTIHEETHSTSEQTKPEDPFSKKIKEWKEKNVLVTMTREEREQEYQKALIELQDTMKEFVETWYSEDPESTKDRIMSKQELSLRYFILTPEEWKQELDEATEWLENLTGKKTPIFRGNRKTSGLVMCRAGMRCFHRFCNHLFKECARRLKALLRGGRRNDWKGKTGGLPSD